MATFGSTAQQGVGVEYNISFDGVAQTWGTDSMVSVSSSRYEAESRDSKLNVPSFRASFYDPTGAIWTALGDGTTAFNKAISVGVKVGGTYDYVDDPLGTFYQKTSTTGADEYTLHTGKIKRVSKANRTVSIESRNNMHILKDLKWQLPISDLKMYKDEGTGGTRSRVASISEKSKYSTVYTEEASIGTYKGKVTAYVADIVVGLSLYQGTGILTSDINVNVESSYSLLDTNFRNTYELIEFDYIEIEGSGTYLDWPNQIDEDTKYFHFVQAEMGISGDPVNMLRHFISGKFVSDYIIDADDVDDASFIASAQNYAFNTFQGTLFAKDSEGKNAFDGVRDIIETTSSMFFVDEVNKVNLVTYGPQDLQTSIDSFVDTDLTDVSTSNEIEDSYNKFTINYAYSNTEDKFISSASLQSDDWSGTDNRELVTESKWLTSKIEAKIINQRLFNRHKNTTPRFSFKTPLSKLGKGISELVKLTDVDSGLNEKIVQINAYNADVISNKEVKYSGLDGDALFLQNGYAHWEDDSDVAGTWWGTAVTSTHTSGWAYGGIQSGLSGGTTPGINEDLYGTAFKWW